MLHIKNNQIYVYIKYTISQIKVKVIHNLINQFKMFEARLVQGALFKKIIEAIRELVVDANLECNESGITMQAMDSSHVSLCALNLKAEGFDHFR